MTTEKSSFQWRLSQTDEQQTKLFGKFQHRLSEGIFEMSTISGLVLKNDRKMNHWRSIYEEWVLAHERFARFSPEDAAYWYSERTNIGIVAGAAWRCGMVALEEFQTTKDNHAVAKRADRKTWAGRCDLWMSRGGKDEIVEAKYRPISLRSKIVAKIAMEMLVKAENDAKNTRFHENMLATGLVFCPIFSNVKLRASTEAMEAQISDLIGAISSIDPTMVAWCFPQATRELIGPGEKSYWPGLVMFGSSV